EGSSATSDGRGMRVRCRLVKIGVFQTADLGAEQPKLRLDPVRVASVDELPAAHAAWHRLFDLNLHVQLPAPTSAVSAAAASDAESRRTIGFSISPTPGITVRSVSPC